MELFFISFLAGVLTVASPCVLPLLPALLAGTTSSQQRRGPFVIIVSLALSVFVFSLLLKGSTALLGVSPDFWLIVSGLIVVAVGVSMLWPRLWEWVATKLQISRLSQAIGTRTKSQENEYVKNALLGLSLGPVFTSCSPTYGLILATILPANQLQGVLYIAMYTLGLAVVLLAIVVGGQSVVKRLGWLAQPHSPARRVLGLLLIFIGLLIISGWIKHIEAWFVENGFLGLNSLEQQIIDGF